MATETLSTALIIEDRASSVLEHIAKNAELATQAIQNVIRATEAVNSVSAITRSNQTKVAKAVTSETVASIQANTAEATAAAKAAATSAQNISSALNNAERRVGFFEKLKKGMKSFQSKFVEILNQGMNIAGWGQIFMQISAFIGRQFSHADNIMNQQARFNMIAEQEGYKGDSVKARGQELRTTNDQIAQALGMNKYAFADISSSFMLQSNGVFKDMKEAQLFTASLRQNFDIVGTEANEAQNAMIQLKQALGSGRLQGDELRSVLENAPNVAKLIEREIEREQGLAVGEAAGQIRKFASEGMVTSKTVKNAVLRAAEETNDTWNKMPNTWAKTFSRLSTLLDNVTQAAYKSFGQLADSPEVINLCMAMVRAFKVLVSIVQSLTPVFKAVFAVITSVLTTVLDTLSMLFENQTIGFIVLGSLAVALAVKLGLVAKMFTFLRSAMMMIAANPLVAILTVLLVITVVLAHLIRTNEDFNAGMLEATAWISHAIQTIGIFFSTISVYGKRVQLGFKLVINDIWNRVSGLIVDILTEVDGMVKAIASTDIGKKLFGDIDTSGFLDAVKAAKDAEGAVRQQEIQKLSNELAAAEAERKALFEDNDRHYEEYRKNIPQYARENVEKNRKDFLGKSVLEGMLEDLQNNMPGAGNNPAEVKGKVSIDTESFEILKRAASAEIVNRYTTLRPIVNARFGDVNNMTAEDAQQLLIDSIREAEGSSIASAVAL